MCCSVPQGNHVVVICAQEKNTKETMTHYHYNFLAINTNAAAPYITTTGWAISPVEDKKANLEKFLFHVESEDRLKLILEKVKTKKLSIEEAILILKGDKSISIG